MKQIRGIAINSTRIRIPSTVDTHESWKLIELARNNKFRVLETALTIEGQIEGIIKHYFFDEPNSKSEAFQSLILASDWCTFSAKRKLLTHIVEERKLLVGKKKADFYDLIRKCISWRNAFTHGKFLSHEGKVLLHYFEGTPREQELTDDFLSDVERIFHSANEAVGGLSFKIGAVKRAESSGEPQ